MTENKDDEKKRYTVVDRRGQDAPAEKGEETEEAKTEEIETEEEGEEENGEEKARLMKVEEFVLLLLNLLREQAAISLGMAPHPGMKIPPRKEEVDLISSFYDRLMRKFGERVFPQLPESPEGSPSLLNLILSCLMILREQILINIGLMANPVTGLVAKDREQARMAIELYSFIVQEIGSLIPEKERKLLEGQISDFQINFARQMIT